MPEIRILTWNVCDLFYEKQRGNIAQKRALLAGACQQHRCAGICVQEAWVCSKWKPDFDAVWQFPIGDGLAGFPASDWHHHAFDCSSGEDSLARKGFAWRDFGTCVVYNVHMQADHAIGWGDSRATRRKQLAQLREHMLTHGDRPIVAVGDFNHRLQGVSREVAVSAANGLDGTLTRNILPLDLSMHCPCKSELSDHPMYIVHARW
tara:strand:- start:8247 stop:8864 length:618 start_codon:yes stop_codon:yes gene_type:complete